MEKRLEGFVAIWLLMLLCPLTVCGEGEMATVRHEAMGTFFEFKLYPPDPAMLSEEVLGISNEAFSAIDGLEARISTWRPDSRTSRVNQFASQRPVETSQELIRLIQSSKKVYEATEGAFDITVGPLLDLWGFYRQQGHLPSEEELKQARDRVGLKYVEVDPEANTVRFLRDGMRLDFGGIGKGLALDYAAEVLRSQGVKSAVLHSGTSTVVALGHPPGKTGWTVAIRSPYNKIREHVDEVSIHDESLSTSSGTERYFELEGKRYGHIFDPRTGIPVDELLSATAIAPTGLESDALSTAFFVIGIEGTKAYCQAHPEIRAILVVLDNDVPKTVRINFPDEEE